MTERMVDPLATIYQSSPTQRIEEIYRDLHDFNIKLVLVKTYQYPLARYKTWSLRAYSRINSLKREGLTAIDVSILTFSPAFRGAGKYYEDHQWKELVILLVQNLDSLRFFAQSRKIPWLENMKAGPFSKRRKAQSVADQYDKFTGKHHIFYLPLKGQPKHCIFPPTQELMSELSECVIDTRNFSRQQRPARYPQTWKYPADVQAPKGLSGNYQYCYICIQPSGPQDKSNICTCDMVSRFSKTLVEVREYSPFPGSSSVNRGIRALQSFKPGDLIGEYVGELIPVEDTDKFGDRIYPMFLDRKDVMPENSDGVAIIISGRKGNWTRFLNHSKIPNVEFFAATMGRKHRIVIRVIKDIAFGEEMLVDYGEYYFQ